MSSAYLKEEENTAVENLQRDAPCQNSRVGVEPEVSQQFSPLMKNKTSST